MENPCVVIRGSPDASPATPSAGKPPAAIAMMRMIRAGRHQSMDALLGGMPVELFSGRRAASCNSGEYLVSVCFWGPPLPEHRGAGAMQWSQERPADTSVPRDA